MRRGDRTKKEDRRPYTPPPPMLAEVKKALKLIDDDKSKILGMTVGGHEITTPGQFVPKAGTYIFIFRLHQDGVFPSIFLLRMHPIISAHSTASIHLAVSLSLFPRFQLRQSIFHAHSVTSICLFTFLLLLRACNDIDPSSRVPSYVSAY